MIKSPAHRWYGYIPRDCLQSMQLIGAEISSRKLRQFEVTLHSNPDQIGHPAGKA
jgi:hypothetical protein